MKQFTRFLFTFMYVITGISFVSIACLNQTISYDASGWMGFIGVVCLFVGFMLEIMDRED